MEVGEYLDFCAKIKGVASGERKTRVADAVEKCRVGDVRTKLIAKLSKGYRQRVGLAQAILNNTDVLILDEPTAGLDPKQIIETRELIKALGGEHTIVLSTHILPEVSMTCGRVLIINKGRVVAEDTPGNLTHRLQGAGALRVEVKGDAASAADVLRAVPGVVAVHSKSEPAVGAVFEVEAESGKDVRAELAAAVVQKGFGLLGLEQVGMSLEDIFLQLTTSDTAAAEAPAPAPPPAPETASTEVSA
jgi:ABC-2 type transport system ATP-binding protein